MNENIKYYLFYAVAYGIILILGEVIYRSLKGGPAWSRSFAHVTAGLISLPFPWLFTSHWWVLILSLQSTLVLWISSRLKVLPSHHTIAVRSAGSYLFFASIYTCFTASYFTGRKELFVIPMLVLTFSDVAAALVGRRYGRRTIQWKLSRNTPGKTYEGSLAFFITAMVVTFLAFYCYLQWGPVRSVPMALTVALLTTATEAFSPFGTDNFFVPLTVLIIMQVSYLI